MYGNRFGSYEKKNDIFPWLCLNITFEPDKLSSHLFTSTDQDLSPMTLRSVARWRHKLTSKLSKTKFFFAEVIDLRPHESRVIPLSTSTTQDLSNGVHVVLMGYQMAPHRSPKNRHPIVRYVLTQACYPWRIPHITKRPI